MRDVHFVTGVKGGSGKTLFSRVLCDYFRHRAKVPLLIVDADADNSDISDVYQAAPASVSDLVVSRCLLAEQDGWVALFDDLEAYPDRTVVINAGAQNLRSLERAADEGFVTGFPEVNSRCTTWWLVTSTVATVELLADFWNIVGRHGGPPGPVHVVRNFGAGNRRNFAFYEETMREKVLAAGGVEVDLPELRESVVETIEAQDAEISLARTLFKAGNRHVLDHWRRRIHGTLAEVLGGG